MSTFTRSELRELAPADLADLIELAEGRTPYECALALGLDPTNPNDREAVDAAVRSRDWTHPTGGPASAAGQEGVRSDLTPAPAEPAPPIDGTPEDFAEAMGLPEPSEHAADDMALLLGRSIATGEPFMAGTFALYAVPDGSVVLVTEDPQGDVKRAVVPPKVVKASVALMTGKGPKGMLGRMLRRG
jgi:hypothetical protein